MLPHVHDDFHTGLPIVAQLLLNRHPKLAFSYLKIPYFYVFHCLVPSSDPCPLAQISFRRIPRGKLVPYCANTLYGEGLLRLCLSNYVEKMRQQKISSMFSVDLLHRRTLLDYYEYLLSYSATYRP